MGPESEPRKECGAGGATATGWSGRGLVIALFGVALLLNHGLLRFYYEPEAKELIGDEINYYHTAVALHEGKEVALDPAWPPLYVRAIAQIFGLFGVERLPVQIVQIAMWLAAAFFLYRIALRVLPWRGAALWALGLFLFTPELSAFSHFLWPEIPHLFFFLGALWLVICHGGKTVALLAAGVLLGLALLTKLVALPFVPVIVVFIVILGRGNPWYRVLRACLFGVVVFVTILPTMLENHKLHGKMMIADSSVFNLWLGLIDVERVDYRNDLTFPEYRAYFRSAPDILTRNRIYEEKVGELIEERGLLETLIGQIDKQYFRLFDCHSFLTTQLPDGPRKAYKSDEAGLAGLIRAWSFLAHGLLLAAFGFGVCLLRFRPVRWTHGLLLFVAYNLFLFLLLHSKTRYLIQFLPVMALFAGIGWTSLFRLLPLNRKSRGSSEGLTGEPEFHGTPVRIALGIVVAMVLLILGFRSLI